MHVVNEIAMYIGQTKSPYPSMWYIDNDTDVTDLF